MQKREIKPLLSTILLYAIGYYIYNKNGGNTHTAENIIKVAVACIFMLMSSALGILIIIKTFENVLKDK